MSELRAAGDHARKMSTSLHKPECGRSPERPLWVKFRPDPKCRSCVTHAERTLWALIADEIDAYLAPDDEPGLFG